MNDSACPKCNSQDIISSARVRPFGAIMTDLGVYVGDQHYGETSTLRARICGQCGYTELFVDNPQKLLVHYKQSQTR